MTQPANERMYTHYVGDDCTGHHLDNYFARVRTALEAFLDQVGEEDRDHCCGCDWHDAALLARAVLAMTPEAAP